MNTHAPSRELACPILFLCTVCMCVLLKSHMTTDSEWALWWVWVYAKMSRLLGASTRTHCRPVVCVLAKHHLTICYMCLMRNRRIVEFGRNNKIGFYAIRRGLWSNCRFQVLISDPGQKCTKVKVSVRRWKFWWNSTLQAPPEPSPGPQNLHLSEGFGAKVKVLSIFSKNFGKSVRWRFFRRILVKSSPGWFWGLSEGFLGRFSPSEG